MITVPFKKYASQLLDFFICKSKEPEMFNIAEYIKEINNEINNLGEPTLVEEYEKDGNRYKRMIWVSDDGNYIKTTVDEIKQKSSQAVQSRLKELDQLQRIAREKKEFAVASQIAREKIELRLNSKITAPYCNGDCGMNYCDEHGCLDNRVVLNEPISPDEERLNQVIRLKNIAIKNQEYAKAAKLRDEEKELKIKLGK
jgi:UvrB/uvrC motif